MWQSDVVGISPWPPSGREGLGQGLHVIMKPSSYADCPIFKFFDSRGGERGGPMCYGVHSINLGGALLSGWMGLVGRRRFAGAAGGWG